MRLTSLAAICSITISTQLLTVHAEEGSRLDPIPVKLQQPLTLDSAFQPIEMGNANPRGQQRGACPSVQVSLTESDFGDGQYILQAGFAQGESLGATYYLSPDLFPIRVDLLEALFATVQTTQQTTTHWSATIWDGTPDDGIQVASFASDGIILPHLVMPPGTAGMIISLTVDEEDPEQIYVYNNSGMNAFSIAFKVVQHNAPGNPCLSSPSTTSNAFPCTDTDGLDYSSQNWINAISGSLCICGSGWFTFLEFPTLCTPSGDWILRASYTPVNCTVDPVACCFTDNSCQDVTPDQCDAFGGEYQGSGTTCATFTCGSGTGACCVESTGNCVEFDLTTCQVVGGIHHGEGTTCATTICFPEGACCLQDGSCSGPMSDVDCVALSGSFQGNDSLCATTECPQPIGACCGADWCLNLTQSDCTAVAGSWSGASTACTESSCQSSCTADLNVDGNVDVIDLLQIVADWGTQGGNGDIDGSGVIDTGDLLAVIAQWGQCE